MRAAASRATAALRSDRGGDSVALLRLINELVHRTGVPLSVEAVTAVGGVAGRGLGRKLADSIIAASASAGGAALT